MKWFNYVLTVLLFLMLVPALLFFGLVDSLEIKNKRIDLDLVRDSDRDMFDDPEYNVSCYV